MSVLLATGEFPLSGEWAFYDDSRLTSKHSLSAKVFHIPFIKLTKGLNLYAIVQRKPSSTDSAPNDYPSLKHYTSIEPLLQDPEVDLVVLSTPPNTHFSFASQALEHGKHVLVEKPFVPTSVEAEKLAALAKEKKRVLCVYQNRRWDADFLTVKKLLTQGTLGRVYEFETHFDRYRADKPTGTWKGELTMAQGGGVLYDLGTHLIDQAFALFGKPTAAYGKFVDQRQGKLVTGESPEEEPDSINAVLSYAEAGLLVHVRIGVLSVESQQPRFWVRGSKGTYHKTGLDTQEPQLRSGSHSVTDPGFGVDSAAFNGRLCVVNDDGSVDEKTYPNVEPETYLRFYELLAKSIESGKEEDVPVPASQSAEVLKIIEALKESAKTGKEVKLS